jgi:DNA-directed RNA polymerase subunit M/transcription elongation factor TFIIS
MVPKNIGTKTILVCRGCGREKKTVKVGEYKITEPSRNKRGEVIVVEEESKRDLEEQRRYMDDLYGIGGDSDFED